MVAYVDFSVGHSTMRVLQHITYDQARDTLRARYMDTMGHEVTYTWVLEHRQVSLGDMNTYFQASVNEDSSQYVDTWHYPDGDPSDATERIVYTRVPDEG